jgi:hypothetical protein
MASKVSENTIAGDMLLVEELTKHLNIPVPERKTWINGCKYGMVAVESMLERAISYVGKIEGSTINGQDFVDGTDAKKVIVTLNDKIGLTRCATIGNVGNKNGSLRVMVADPKIRKNYYFIIPKSECSGKLTVKIPFAKEGGPPDFLYQKNQELLKKYENGETVDYDSMDLSVKAWLKYRVFSFRELATSFEKELAENVD